MKKTTTCLLLGLALLLSLAAPARAAEPGEREDAQVLYQLGLFRGAGILADGSVDFALEKPLSRQEAVVMLVRLLGGEQTAFGGSWDTPFADVVAWAQPYVGYAYDAGLANGIGTGRFGGTQPTTATQYLTFLLRALGYVSGEDFRWDAAWEKTDELGITSGEYTDTSDGDEPFLRGDAAALSRRALLAQRKSGGTLIDQLVADGAVSREAVDQSGLLPDSYTLFARELVAAGHDSVTVVPDGYDCVGAKVLPQESCFREFDGYSGYGDTPEQALANALESYLLDCLDGDYSNGYAGTNTFGGWGLYVDAPAAAFVLTDSRGTVICYGIRTDNRKGQSFTMYYCDLDSKGFVDPLVKSFGETVAGLKELTCTVEKVDGCFVYTVGDIPESAAYYSLQDIGYDADPWGHRSREWHLFVSMKHAAQHIIELHPLGGESSLEAEAVDSQWSEVRQLVMLWDAEKTLIGYATVGIRLSR